MEQWIYSKLYNEAIKVLVEANREFNSDDPLDFVEEEDMLDVLCALNKLSFTIGKVVRNKMERR